MIAVSIFCTDTSKRRTYELEVFSRLFPLLCSQFDQPAKEMKLDKIHRSDLVLQGENNRGSLSDEQRGKA